MYRQGSDWLYITLTAISIALVFNACTNDLKKIREISAKQVNSPADTTYGVDVIISDSARVKARMITSLMLTYAVSKDNSQQYRYMPKGVKVILFDRNHKESANIIADTAYYYEATGVIKLRKNVVATSIKGDVFKSDEINYDKNTHRITSGLPVEIRSANGNIAHGTSLETNDKFDPFSLKNSTGAVFLDNKIGQ